MNYESWRISFQSSESAARAAFKEWQAARNQSNGYTPNDFFNWLDAYCLGMVITEQSLRDEYAKMLASPDSNQSNNVPVAKTEAITHLWESLGKWSAYLVSHGEQANLAPPDWLLDAIEDATSSPPDTANVLEMAAKICDDMQRELNKKHLYDVNTYGTCQISGFRFADAIRNLIQHPESTAPQQEISVDLDALIYEHTRFNVNQAEDAITIKGIKSLINAVLSAAPQPESEGK